MLSVSPSLARGCWVSASDHDLAAAHPHEMSREHPQRVPARLSPGHAAWPGCAPPGLLHQHGASQASLGPAEASGQGRDRSL